MRRLLLLVPWLGTWLLYRENRAAKARFERLLADLNNIALERIEVRDSELIMELARDGLGPRIWAGIWRAVIDQVGAPNFLEFKFGQQPGETGWLVVTVQRVPGKTPAEKLREAEDEIARLRQVAP